MERITLTDGSGAWFDKNTTIEFKEDTFWNGSNHVSMVTKSQTEHEYLYFTASGAWVLNPWSQYQGSCDTYERITPQQAAVWMNINGHNHVSLKDTIADLEI